MPKRPHGGGTITHRKDGRWAVGVSLPDGGRRWFYAKTQKEAQATLDQLPRILHGALEQALDWELVGRNVADRVSPGRVPKQTFTVLTAEQARQLLAAAAGERLEALYVLALHTGMRQGELLGLRW